MQVRYPKMVERPVTTLDASVLERLNFAQVCMVPKLDVGMLLELFNFTCKDLGFGIFESNLRSLCQDPIRRSAS